MFIQTQKKFDAVVGHFWQATVYAKFEDAFLEEEITVNAIKDLTDEQLQKLGMMKIGWQKNITTILT
ncbi:unnamed protein product [Rhizophagus irregularis]|nr:unnamed protein product [Rhizophagus irregularis]